MDDETGNYYYGARYYNQKWSIWLSVDPLAEKYPGWSPYNYTLLNPVKLVDPDGRSVDWKPIIYDDGSISYQKEKGDNETTLKSQYGLSSDAAHALYSNMENGEISGKTVQEVTGSKILKLNDFSNPQKNLDHAMFAFRTAEYRGDDIDNVNVMLVSDYFKIRGKPSTPIRAAGRLDVGDEQIELVFDLLTYSSTNNFSKNYFEASYVFGLRTQQSPREPLEIFLVMALKP